MIYGFLSMSIDQILEGYRKREFSPVEVAQGCAAQIKKWEADVAALVCFDEEILMRYARAAEERLMKGEEIRLLEGIPVGIKDIFNTADFPTQMGSPLWEGFTPGNDARVVYQLKSQGAIIPGKTVTAEFAVHTLGKTRNPHNPDMTPGTSSSGSAVSVATGMFPASIGTQTAGSIVRPASFCGIYGCKPSFGLIPRTGSLKTTDSLDTVGYFVAHLEDARSMFATLRVHGANYPIANRALEDVKRQSRADDKPWRVALVKTHLWESMPAYARESLIDWSEKIERDPEVELVELELPEAMEESHDIHSIIYDSTLAYYFQEEFKKKELVSPIMNNIIERGMSITPEEYRKALSRQEELAEKMDSFFSDCDIFISLATAGSAPPREETEQPDPALMWTLTHLPVISAPVFRSPEGLPFGLQVAARRYNDLLLFSFLEFLASRGFVPEGGYPSLKGREVICVE